MSYKVKFLKAVIANGKGHNIGDIDTVTPEEFKTLSIFKMAEELKEELDEQKKDKIVNKEEENSDKIVNREQEIKSKHKK